MAGGNPTAWRGALRRQATRGAGHGRGPSSRDGGSPPGAVHRPLRRSVAGPRLSGQRAAAGPWPSAAGPGCPGPPWPRAARGTGARRTGSPRSARRTIHSASVAATAADERVGAPRAPCAPPTPRCSDWVPSKTAQSVRRSPAKSGPRTKRMAPEEPLRVVRRGERREPLDVGRDRVAQPEVDAAGKVQAAVRRRGPAPAGRPRRSSARWTATPAGRARSPAPTRHDGPLAGGRRGRRRARARPSGGTVRPRRGRRPDRGPRLRRRRGSRRGTVGATRPAWGRRDSNPHWGRFKRPASASWATPPAHHS